MMLKILLFFITLLPSKKEYFCSCIPLSVEESLVQADMVFSGRVVKIDTVKIINEVFITADWATPDSGAYVMGSLVTLDVKRVFKGIERNGSLSIMTGIGGGDCGYYFQKGHDYMVYAEMQNYFIIDSVYSDDPNRFKSHPSEYFSTNDCFRTTHMVAQEQKLLMQALSRQEKDSVALKSFWEDYRKSILSRDNSRLAELFEYPFSCRPCINYAAHRIMDNAETVWVTKEDLFQDYFKEFFNEAKRSEVVDNPNFNMNNFFPVSDIMGTFAYKFPFTIDPPSANFEGAQGFVYIEKRMGKFKITGIDMVP